MSVGLLTPILEYLEKKFDAVLVDTPDGPKIIERRCSNCSLRGLCEETVMILACEKWVYEDES